MKNFKLTYFISFLCILFLFSCNSTKHVPDGRYLVHKNVIEFTDEKLDADAVAAIIRQNPNKAFLGIKFKLAIYNAMDSTKVAKSSNRKIKKIKHINAKKINRQNRINQKRIAKAKLKGRK